MIALLFLACGEPETVQPLVEARAEDVGVAAAPGVRLAVGSGALGAWLCSLDQTDLRELAQDPDTGGAAVPTIDAPADVGANLGVLGAGSVFWNTETGVATMSFTGSLDASQALTIDVVIDTPTREFEVSFRDPDGSAFSASALVAVEDCAASPRVQVELELDDGVGDAVRVVLPDSDGELLEWNSGQLAPRTGTASWSRGSGVSKETWLADDAASLDDAQWPGTASSADWSAAATVSLSRPD